MGKFLHLQTSLASRQGKEISAIVLLVVLVGAFFVPAILGGKGIFHDDLAMDEFPRMYFFARHLQSGHIPLWRSDIWCGARVLYSDFYSNLYYPPWWPFLLLADLSDLDVAYHYLCIAPLLLHYFIAAVGMYLLTRFALDLKRSASLLSAVFYALSPALVFGYVGLSNLSLAAWIPWFIWVFIAISKKPGLPLLYFGGVVFAFMLTTAALPYLVYVLVLSVAVGAVLLFGRRYLPSFYPVWRPPLALAGFILSGLVLSAVYWLPAFEGISAVRESGMITYEFAAGGEGSLDPLYLSSLLLPGLFGGLNGTHLWGLGPVRFWEANMTGGLAVTLLVLLGFFLPWTLPKAERKTRVLRLISAATGAIYLASLLLMLGRHTVFYRIFWHFLPLAGKLPYPIRYRLLQCSAAAVLGGLGLHLLFDPRVRERTVFRRRLISVYLVATASIVAAILFWPPAKIMEVIATGDITWFVTSPIFHLALGVGLITLISRASSGRSFARFLAILAVLEIGYTAFHAFYLCTFQMGGEIYPQHQRAKGPGSHPMYQRVLSVLPPYLGETDLRIASDQPFYDNLHQCGEYSALMGYDMKPLRPRFQRAVEAAYQHPLEWNYLYGLHRDFPRAQHPSFYNNMSVGFFLSSFSENPFTRSVGVGTVLSPEYYLHFNPNALPRAFTLDRIVRCSEDEAQAELVGGDLRRGVFVEEGNRLSVIGNQLAGGHRDADRRLPITDYRSFNPGTETEYLSHFAELQTANPITRLDLDNPNRVEVDLTITEPAMLVLTEVWHPGWEVRVDGEPADLYRVNYLQRGVWLEEGTHHIDLVFSPDFWKIGAVISAISWGIVILGLLGWGVRNGFRAKPRGIGKQIL